MMRDVFQGFLILRLLALCALLTVGAVALGISSLARGSDLTGVVLLLAAAFLAGMTGWLLAHRPGARRERG
ncbi:MAG TPA: hypothetical protein VGJ14_16480 [Sporichthyaceae bacterium]